MDWEAVWSAKISLARNRERTFTQQSGILIPQVIYLQTDNVIQLFNFVSEKFCNDGRPVIRTRDAILHCVAISPTPQQSEYYRLLSVWTSDEVVFFGVTPHKPTRPALAEIPLRDENDGSEDSMYLVTIDEFTLKLPSSPQHVCGFLGSRLIVVFDGDDLGLHELVFRKSWIGPAVVLVRLVLGTGFHNSRADLEAIRDAGVAGLIRFKVASRLTDGLSKMLNAVTPKSDSQMGRRIVAIGSAYYREYAVLVTVDDADYLRIYAPHALILDRPPTEKEALARAARKKHRRDSAVHETLKLCTSEKCSTLIKSISWHASVSVDRAVGKVIAVSVQPMYQDLTTFQITLITEQAKRVQVQLDIERMSLCVEALLDSQLPATVPLKAEPGSNSPSKTSTTIIADVNSSVRSPVSTLPLSPLTNNRIIPYSRSPATYRLESCPRFQKAKAWDSGSVLAIEFAKAVNTQAGGEISVFSLAQAQLKVTSGLNQPLMHAIETVIDIAQDSYWSRSILKSGWLVDSTKTTPRLVAGSQPFHVALQNLIASPSIVIDAAAAAAATQTTPATERTSYSSAYTGERSKLLQRKLLVVSEDVIWPVRLELLGGADALRPLEREFLDALIGIGPCSRFKESWRQLITLPHERGPFTKTETAAASAAAELLHTLTQFYFGDLLDQSFLVSTAARQECPPVYLINPDIVLRARRVSKLLPRIKDLLNTSSDSMLHAADVILPLDECQPSDARRLQSLRDIHCKLERLLTLVDFTELVIYAADVTLREADLAEDGRAGASVAGLCKMTMREIVDAPFLLTRYIAHVLDHLCSKSRAPRVESNLLTELLAKCPRYISAETVREHVIKLQKTDDAADSVVDAPVSQHGEPVWDGDTQDQIVEFLTNNADTKELYSVISKVLGNLIEQKNWKRLVRIAYEIQLKSVDHPEESQNTRSRNMSGGANTLYDDIKDCFLYHIELLRAAKAADDLVAILREIKQQISSTVRAGKRERYASGVILWGWVLKPCLAEPLFDPLKALLSKTVAQQPEEKSCAHYFAEDPVIKSIFSDEFLSENGFLEARLSTIYTLDPYMPISHKLILFVALTAGIDLLSRSLPSIVEELTSDLRYLSGDVVELIYHFKPAILRHVTDMNASRMDGSPACRSRLNGPSSTRFDVASPIGTLNYHDSNMERMCFIFTTLLKPLEFELRRRYKGEYGAIAANSALQDYMRGPFDQDLLLTAYKENDGQFRAEMIERVGLALDYPVLQSILSFEKLYDYKMLLTALEGKFCHAADPGVTHYERLNFAESFVGMVAMFLLPKSRDCRDLVDFISAASLDSPFGSVIPNVFANEEVVKLVRKVNHEHNGGLGPCISELVNDLIRTSGKNADSTITGDLLKLIGDYQAPSGSATREKYEEVLKNQIKEALPLFFK